MKRFLKPTLTVQILIALALAIVVGYCIQDYSEFANAYIKPFGTIFLNLLKFIVVPLVILSIICGILSMRDASKIGRISVSALIYFISTTIFAVCLGLSVATLLKGYFPAIELEQTFEQTEVLSISFIDQLVSFFPKNIIEPLYTTSMMPVIIMALFFGFAIMQCGAKAKPVADFVIALNEVVIKILHYIMALTPIGVFCMLTPVVAVNGPNILGSYAILIGTDYLCFLLHIVLIYAILVKVLGKTSPLRFFKNMVPAMLFAYSSDSSIATLPVSMECTKKLGVKEEIGNFILSLGATINMDGVAIYLGVTSVFFATAYGIDLSLSQYVAIAISATIASIGTPGVPGGSLALMTVVFASAGIPVEGVAIAAGIDRIVDMGRTTMSITGDASCAVVINKMVAEEENESL